MPALHTTNSSHRTRQQQRRHSTHTLLCTLPTSMYA
jgi:hypothetical protein